MTDEEKEMYVNRIIEVALNKQGEEKEKIGEIIEEICDKGYNEGYLARKKEYRD